MSKLLFFAIAAANLLYRPLLYLYLLMGKETGLPAYVDATQIAGIKMCCEGSSPYFRLHLKNGKEHHDYCLDVLATQEEIDEIKRACRKNDND